MKAMLFSLIILSYFGITDSMAQQGNNNEDLGVAIFGLLKQKHTYEDLMSRKKTNSAEERKTLAASELNKSEYGRSLKVIKDNAAKYLSYIDKAIGADAEVLSKDWVNYEKVPAWDNGRHDRNVISKLDYLKAFKYSLFIKKSDALLELYLIPGIKMKYEIPKSQAIKPKQH